MNLHSRTSMGPLLGLATVAVYLGLSVAQAGGFVIVHASNGNELNGNQIAQIFLGKTSRFPDGSRVEPLDQSAGSDLREAFSRQILRRSAGQVRAYWSQQMFTGRGTPPPELDGDGAVVQRVASTPGAIGYVSRVDGAAGVRVVEEF